MEGQGRGEARCGGEGTCETRRWWTDQPLMVLNASSSALPHPAPPTPTQQTAASRQRASTTAAGTPLRARRAQLRDEGGREAEARQAAHGESRLGVDLARGSPKALSWERKKGTAAHQM
eukprot:742815-Rhodomonas_salina.1